LKEGNFELILANIYGDILLDVAEDLVNKTASGAHILLSGILWEYNFDVRKKYQKLGCMLIKNRLLDEFSTLLLQKI
jgi:ribosomal protein L11 methyltransferase